jgi:hypothetical protein
MSFEMCNDRDVWKATRAGSIATPQRRGVNKARPFWTGVDLQHFLGNDFSSPRSDSSLPFTSQEFESCSRRATAPVLTNRKLGIRVFLRTMVVVQAGIYATAMSAQFCAAQREKPGGECGLS